MGDSAQWAEEGDDILALLEKCTSHMPLTLGFRWGQQGSSQLTAPEEGGAGRLRQDEIS